MLRSLRPLLAALALALGPGAVFAQGAQVAFGGLKQDPTLPVQVTADQLNVSQSDGTAIFTGNVLVGQGTMRLAAPKVRVEYAKGSAGKEGRISRMFAYDGVTLTNGGEAAESKDAVYTVDTGEVVMTGDVVLTQGQNALSGQKLVIDLVRGTGVMEGRVQTVFTPGSKP